MLPKKQFKFALKSTLDLQSSRDIERFINQFNMLCWFHSSGKQNIFLFHLKQTDAASKINIFSICYKSVLSSSYPLVPHWFINNTKNC